MYLLPFFSICACVFALWPWIRAVTNQTIPFVDSMIGEADVSGDTSRFLPLDFSRSGTSLALFPKDIQWRILYPLPYLVTNSSPSPLRLSPLLVYYEREVVCLECGPNQRLPIESAATSAAWVVKGGVELSPCLSASFWLLYWSSSLPLGGVYRATPPLFLCWAQMQLYTKQGGRLANDTLFAWVKRGGGLKDWGFQNCLSSFPIFVYCGHLSLGKKKFTWRGGGLIPVMTDLFC